MNRRHTAMSKIKTSLISSCNSGRHRFGSVLMYLFCAFGFSGFLSSAGAETLPETAKMLPPQTVLLLDIQDFQQMKMRFKKTCLYDLYKDPAMAAFAKNAKVKLQERIQKLDENDIFKTIFNTELQPQGKAAFAFVLNEQSRDFNDLQIVVITQWGEGIDKIKSAVDEMLQKNIEYGGHQKLSEDYRGVSVQTTMDEASSELDHCFIDDCFIATTNLDLLKFIIAHIRGVSSPALADDTDYTFTMKAVGPYHDIDFYVNIKQIIKARLAEDSSGKTSELLNNLGLDNVAALGSSVGFTREPGISNNVKVFLRINGAKRGICKMLESDSAIIKAPRFIAVPAYSTTFFNLDIKKAYDEFYNILYTFNPQYVSLMNVFDLPDSPTGEPGVKLKSDIISHLGSQIILSESINKPFSDKSAPTDSLVGFAVNNRDALEKSLSQLHSKLLAPNDPDARRELLGHTIYLLRPSALPFLSRRKTPMQITSESDVPQTAELAFTITDTYLIFASEAVIERAIRTLNNTDALSVGSSKWFTAAKSVIPSAVGMAALQDVAASSELFWWTVKESGKARSSSNVKDMELDGVADFTLLPEFAAVRKYFGLSAFYGISKPDGFFFEFKYLNPQVGD